MAALCASGILCSISATTVLIARARTSSLGSSSIVSSIGLRTSDGSGPGRAVEAHAWRPARACAALTNALVHRAGMSRPIERPVTVFDGRVLVPPSRASASVAPRGMPVSGVSSDGLPGREAPALSFTRDRLSLPAVDRARVPAYPILLTGTA